MCLEPGPRRGWGRITPVWQAWFFSRMPIGSPDFPTAARPASLAFYRRRGQGVQAQGVIVFEPSLIVPLLNLDRSPVAVPGARRGH